MAEFKNVILLKHRASSYLEAQMYMICYVASEFYLEGINSLKITYRTGFESGLCHG